MDRNKFYHIILTSNHKEHHPVLIGESDDPAKFIAEWLGKRSQYTGEYTNEDKTRWIGFNSYNDWKTLDIKYRREVKWALVNGEIVYEKDDKGNYVPDASFDYKITTTEMRNQELYIPLEGDARYI